MRLPFVVWASRLRPLGFAEASPPARIRGDRRSSATMVTPHRGRNFHTISTFGLLLFWECGAFSSPENYGNDTVRVVHASAIHSQGKESQPGAGKREVKMFKKRGLVSAIAFVLAVLLPATMFAEKVSVPSGTRVFIELDQLVTSKKKHNAEGSFVRAHVWRDVIVDGRAVIKAGTGALVQVGDIKGAKVAGVKGFVELKALQVPAIDGSDVMLVGGYDRSGKSLVALSVALAVIVFVPLIFLKGKQAKLQPGTIFDAMVANQVHVESEDVASADLGPRDAKPLTVSILYEQLESEPEGGAEVKELPLRITIEGDSVDGARVVEVNGAPIEPIPITVGQTPEAKEGWVTVDGTVNLKAIGKHFSEGFNRFTVEVGGFTDEVILDLEL
jgi:hypothetical protein